MKKLSKKQSKNQKIEALKQERDFWKSKYQELFALTKDNTKKFDEFDLLVGYHSLFNH